MSKNLFLNRPIFLYNVEKYDTTRQATSDNMIRHMRNGCWITKATDTHSELEILIAFPRQSTLSERSLMCIACLISILDCSVTDWKAFNQIRSQLLLHN